MFTLWIGPFEGRDFALLKQSIMVFDVGSTYDVFVSERRDPAGVDAVLRSLPGWFGIQSAVEQYVRDAADPEFTSLTASRDDRCVGVALLRPRYPETIELHLIAVASGHRHQGIGRQLVEAAAAVVMSEGGAMLSVHTVGPSSDDLGYAETRRFYRSVGFFPIEEHNNLDWAGPTLIMVRPLATGAVR